MRIGGVDGVPTGWVVCVLTGSGRNREVSWTVVPDAAAVLDTVSGCDAVGIDIPLAVPSGRARRDAELLASTRLGAARSSLFPTPPAPVLAATTYAEACATAQSVTGKKISVQAWNLVPKIRQFQEVTLPGSVVEAHPELTFRTMAPEVAFASKKTARGAGQRIAALAGWVDPACSLGELPAAARLDDVLDALATAWTAERVVAGTAELLGPGTDDRGRSTAIAV
jgi:predicted RNase H-like nuclease